MTSADPLFDIIKAADVRTERIPSVYFNGTVREKHVTITGKSGIAKEDKGIAIPTKGLDSLTTCFLEQFHDIVVLFIGHAGMNRVGRKGKADGIGEALSVLHQFAKFILVLMIMLGHGLVRNGLPGSIKADDGKHRNGH